LGFLVWKYTIWQPWSKRAIEYSRNGRQNVKLKILFFVQNTLFLGNA
jgi:hypothetical protein